MIPLGLDTCGTIGTMIKDRKVCVCEDCGHEWLPDGDAVEVKRCARCKSRKWNAGGEGGSVNKTSEVEQIPTI